MTLPLGDHFFRHEYGRLVAMLSRRFGVGYVEEVEDAVQSALLAALEALSRGHRPDNPSAWLYRVARNHLLGDLRQRARRDRLAAQHDLEDALAQAAQPPQDGSADDDLLHMLVVCCEPEIPIESQLVLALKTLCGFDVREIAERLFTSEANVYKRLGRARARLRELPFSPDEVTAADLVARLPAVRAILYLLFTEGYLSSHADGAIRRELCDEATRLATLLAGHPLGAAPETFALVALMHLHSARMSSRQDGAGGLLLLEEQDRARWDQQEIATGLAWLARSAGGDTFTRFHAEAGVAAEHCLAPTFAQTRWDRIVECYAALDRLAPSALHTLNRAVAVAEWRGPAEGLAVLAGMAPPSWLTGSYLWAAVLADLHGRCGHAELARRHREVALAGAPSPAVRAALARRLGDRGAR